MLSIKEHLTILYVTVADFFATHPNLAQWRESNHSQPAFTDAEVLTIALMQSYFRTDTLSRTFLLVRANDPQAFPTCCTYKQWLCRQRPLVAASGRADCGVGRAARPPSHSFICSMLNRSPSVSRFVIVV